MLFETGHIVTTQPVARTLKQSFILECLRKHTSGDYGTISIGSAEMNNQAAKDNSDYILSIYPNDTNRDLWIKTEYDKSVTTLYFGDED